MHALPPTGPYRLLEKIGAGGVGTVYRAEGPEGPAAVKVLLGARPDDVRRLRREFLTLERLDHPGIVKVFDYGEEDGRAWLAMELVDGPDLGRLIEGWAGLAPAERWARTEAILRQLCEALAYLQDRGIVHRDLKPQNVLVSADGRARLSDFGALKDADAGHSSLTVAGQLIGTVAFLAPEAIVGDGSDHRADLYSLGAILYVMLTGRRPITADSIAGYLARHLAEMPRPPSEFSSEVPPRLERVCMRLLQKERSHRPASARQVLAMLDAGAGVGGEVHGREAELASLLQRLEFVRRTGVGVCVQLRGRPGSGRSALLGELRRRAREAGASLDGQAPGPVHLRTLDDCEELPLPAERTLVVYVPRREVPGEHLDLSPLDGHAVRAMLRDLGLGGGFGAILARRILDAVPPWPAEILQQVEALVEAGWVSRSDGLLRPVLGADEVRSAPLPVPLSVVAAEAAALADLEAEQRSAFEALVVIGQAAPARLVASVARLPEATTAAALADLAGVGRVAITTEGLEELHAVSDQRRAAAAYEAIPPSHRATLHAAAAEALLGLYRRRSGAVSETVAQHLVRAGRPEAALPLLVQAAWRGLRRSDLAGARSLLRRAQAAAELGKEPQLVARWLRELALARGDLERLAGRPAEAEDAYSQAHFSARQGGSPEDAGHALAGIGLAHLARGRLSEAAERIREGIASLGPGHRAWPDAVDGLAVIALERGQLEAAAAHWTELGEVARATGQLRVELQADLGLALVAWARGGDPVASLEEASVRARDAGLAEVATRALVAGAECRLDRGDASGALRLAQVLDELGDRHGHPLADAAARAYRGAALFLGGSADRAREAAEEAAATLRLHQLRALGTWAWTARVMVATGGRGAALLELAEGGFPPEPPWPAAATRAAVQGLLLATIEPRPAADRARQALRGLREAAFAGAARRVATDVANTFFHLGDAAQGNAILREIERASLRMADADRLRRASRGEPDDA